MIPAKNRTIIYKSETNIQNKNLRIIHFNDVYNIEGLKEEPVGGASRFRTVLNHLNKNQQNLVLFSGDAFSPSTCINYLIFYKIKKNKICKLFFFN